MKTTFDDIIEEVLEAEGGFVNDPDDKGGATNFGVTQQSYSNFLGSPASVDDVRNMTRDEAKECYKKDWNNRYYVYNWVKWCVCFWKARD